VGSLLYGPILAAFLLGMLTRWANAFAIKSGIIAGIVLNILLWQLTSISWLWWNLTGFIAVIIVALTFSIRSITRKKIAKKESPEKKASPSGAELEPIESKKIESGHVELEPEEPSKINWPTIYVMVGLYTILIIVVSFLIEKIA
jgi:Na+/proline symporter